MGASHLVSSPTSRDPQFTPPSCGNPLCASSRNAITFQGPLGKDHGDPKRGPRESAFIPRLSYHNPRCQCADSPDQRSLPRRAGAPLPFDALDEAKRNMKEHFAVVGVINRFDKARLLMKKRMGWVNPFSCTRRNPAPEPFSVNGRSPDLVTRIRKLTEVAAELVAHASKLLTDAIECEGDNFQHEFAKTRKLNHLNHLVMNGWKVGHFGRAEMPRSASVTASDPALCGRSHCIAAITSPRFRQALCCHQIRIIPYFRNWPFPRSRQRRNPESDPLTSQHV